MLASSCSAGGGANGELTGYVEPSDGQSTEAPPSEPAATDPPQSNGEAEPATAPAEANEPGDADSPEEGRGTDNDDDDDDDDRDDDDDDDADDTDGDPNPPAAEPVLPTAMPVTFTNDIRPILVANCARCHASGGLPNFASNNATTGYSIAVRERNDIVALIEAGEMPADTCRGAPGSSGCVSATDFGLIREWVAAGAPE